VYAGVASSFDMSSLLPRPEGRRGQRQVLCRAKEQRGKSSAALSFKTTQTTILSQAAKGGGC